VNDQTRPCENCGAPLPLTGTYCLACDTPVSGLREDRLSVAETESVRRGRPIQGIALVTGCVLALVAVTYALVLVIRPNHDREARKSVANAVGLLARAESGEHVCRSLHAYLAEKPPAYMSACHALVGTRAGLRLENLHAGAVKLSGRHGTVHLTATLVDGSTSQPLDDVIKVRDVDDSWRMVWNRRPLT
jgi:hypothetical protein